MAIKLKKNIHNSVQTPSRMCIIHVQAHNTPHTRTQTLDWQPNNNELETAIKAMMQTEQRQRQIWQKIKRSETINVGLQRVQKRERQQREAVPTAHKLCTQPIFYWGNNVAYILENAKNGDNGKRRKIKALYQPNRIYRAAFNQSTYAYVWYTLGYLVQYIST